MSVLILLIGTPLVLKQNWKQFLGTKKSWQSLSGEINNVKAFNEHEEITLQQAIADTARIIFRFTPHTCSCLEPDFSDAVKRVKKEIGENKVIVVIAAEDSKEIFFFRERTKLSGPVYSATDTIFALFDTSQTPYACVVYPDMTAQNIVSINADNINELISHAKKIIR